MSDDRLAVSATTVVRADQNDGPAISRNLFGKFTEHLGRNVYGGAWAETLENPWFAAFDAWPEPDFLRRQLSAAASEHGLPELNPSPDSQLAPHWMPKGDLQVKVDRGIRGPSQQITTRGAGTGLRALVYLPLHRQRGHRLTIRGRASKTTRIVARLLTLGGDELSWGDVSLGPGAWHTVQRTLRRAPGRNLPASTPLILEIQLEHPVTIWLDRCSLIPADDRYGPGSHSLDDRRPLTDASFSCRQFRFGLSLAGWDRPCRSETDSAESRVAHYRME